MSRSEWWSFMAWNYYGTRAHSSFYDFVMQGIISRPKDIVRFDHPERKLVGKFFSAQLLGEKRVEK